MKIGRRAILGHLAATPMLIATALAEPQGAHPMYGMIVKITAAPGKRDELIAILLKSTTEMPGCLSYVVSKDSADENAIWITEAWDSVESHTASLSLPSVKDTIAQAKPMIAGFEKIAAIAPVGGVGLPSTKTR